MASSSPNRSIKDVLTSTGRIVKQGSRTLKTSPQVTAYPYMAFVFIIITFPTINTLAFNIWHWLSPQSIISISNTPRTARVLVGLVSFSVFYTALVTAYFICAVSAEVLARLDGRPISLTYGLHQIAKRFPRVSWFALAAIFFFPLGIIAQRRKLTRFPRGFVEVLGSSYTLHTPQLAPAIITKDASVVETVRDSINTLGEAWKEGLVIRLGMFLAFIIVGGIGFLPKLVQHYWFNGPSAQFIGWLVSAFIWATGYVTIKVLGTVFTTTLYHEAAQKK